MNKQELKDEIYRLKTELYRQIDYDTRMAIMKREMELAEMSGVNKTKNGTVRHYLTSNASKKVLEDYLTNMINAQYDILGRSL